MGPWNRLLPKIQPFHGIEKTKAFQNFTSKLSYAQVLKKSTSPVVPSVPSTSSCRCTHIGTLVEQC